MVYDYNPNILEAEEGGSRVPSQPGSYTETVFRNKNNKNRQTALYQVTKTNQQQQTPRQTYKQLSIPT